MRALSTKSVFLIMIIITFWSCTKKDDNTSPHIRISQEGIDWFYYKQGSYWIYQNETTLKSDSIIVDSASIIKRLISSSQYAPGSYIEYMQVSFHPNFMHQSFDDAWGVGGSVVTRHYTDSTSYSIFSLDYENVIGQVVKGYNTKDSLVYTREYLGHKDSIKIENNWFVDVMSIKVHDIVNNSVITFIQAKGVGTIQYQIVENYDTTIYNLIEWKAFQ